MFLRGKIIIWVIKTFIKNIIPLVLSSMIWTIFREIDIIQISDNLFIILFFGTFVILAVVQWFVVLFIKVLLGKE